MSDRDRQPDDETDRGASRPPPSQPRRPPSPFYRHRISSISITGPVGLFAPLLATPPRPHDDEEPAADRGTLEPATVDPVTVAQTQSVAIPLDVRAPRSGSLATTLALGAAGALFLAVIMFVSTAAVIRPRAASVFPPPPAEQAMRSFAAPVPAPLPAQPAAVAPGAAPVVAVSVPAPAPTTPSNASPKSKTTSSQTVVVLPRSSTGHRIFVDGRMVGSGPDPVTVKCGHHSIKIGSAGKARVKDLPCGGEITLPPN